MTLSLTTDPGDLRPIWARRSQTPLDLSPTMGIIMMRCSPPTPKSPITGCRRATGQRPQQGSSAKALTGTGVTLACGDFASSANTGAPQAKRSADRTILHRVRAGVVTIALFCPAHAPIFPQHIPYQQLPGWKGAVRHSHTENVLIRH